MSITQVVRKWSFAEGLDRSPRDRIGEVKDAHTQSLLDCIIKDSPLLGKPLGARHRQINSQSQSRPSGKMKS